MVLVIEAQGIHHSKGSPRRRIADRLGPPARSVLLALQDPVAAGRLAQRFSEHRLVPTLAFSCDQLLDQARHEHHVLIVVDEVFTCDHVSPCLNHVQQISDSPIIAVGNVSEADHAVLELTLPVDTGTEVVAAQGLALIAMARPVELPHPIRWGGLELNMRTHQASWGGQPLHLTTIQFRIMEVLALAGGGLVTTEQLACRVWGDGSFADHDRLMAHIRRIRKLIESRPSAPEFLLRVRGRGFRLRAEDEPG
jgi:DNA-binding response OmpR family regulator